jgi:hypothetical protein
MSIFGLLGRSMYKSTLCYYRCLHYKYIRVYLYLVAARHEIKSQTAFPLNPANGKLNQLGAGLDKQFLTDMRPVSLDCFDTHMQ